MDTSTSKIATLYVTDGFQIIIMGHGDKLYYYSTMMSFYHIWSRERAKYETVIHCSVPV